MAFVKDGFVFPDWAADIFAQQDAQTAFIRDGGNVGEIVEIETFFLGGTLEELGGL